MDEYAEHIYQRRPEYRHLSAGDVAAQKKLRSSLNCKSFKWFMTKIAWDLPKFYPPVEPPAAAWGEIRNVGTGLCADTKHGALGSPLRLESCVRGRGEAAWNNMQVRATSQGLAARSSWAICGLECSRGQGRERDAKGQ